ncbi:hyaluronate lyase [Pedobacter sp. ok626]|uniref:polysaccharide lyase 8 family protein n=1 Tax=Pedobacter sp. ok626 TaxID=1761882 RepID=UPI00087F67D8|nr:polysaccharide lyase 8 family protein [Pedobacter sp. ok626]SDJ54006.1 hyaluronate lyase [Pedobacter sp. ok626]
MKTIGVLVYLLISSCLSFKIYAQDSFSNKQFNCDSLRIKWSNFLIGGKYNPNDPPIKNKLSIINKNSVSFWKNGFVNDTVNRKALWLDLKYVKSADITTSYTRLYSMAIAYCSPGTTGYQNQQLKGDILSALEWLYTKKYNERTIIPKTGGNNNWWDYRIGSPEKLNNIIVLLYDDISPEWRAAYVRAIQHATPSVEGYTGANLVWISRVIAISSIVAQNPSKVSYAINALSPVFNYVTEGDGFYADGSFLQHNKHPYSGGYGVNLLSSLAELMYLFPEIPQLIPHATNLYSWVYDSFEPIVYRGGIMSSVMGREIARSNISEHSKGRALTEALILLAHQAPEKEAQRLKSVVKSYLLEDGSKTGFSSIVLTQMATELMNDKTIVPRPTYTTCRQLANMDRAVQQADHYAFMLSMHSARIYNFESINQENLKGWHLSDGMTYLYNTDKKQFEDDFWSTVNYQHLPGTTTEEDLTALPNKSSTKSWVGGTALGKYGVSGMDLSPFGTTLSAKKSWFMLADGIVCLGAGITNQDNRNVLTTIEQRKLSLENSNTFTLDGKIIPGDFDISDRPNVKWAHLSGNVKGADIGYYFPEGIQLSMKRMPQSGKWSEVRTGTDSTLQTRNYLTLWKAQGNHSIDDNNAENKYAYLLLPGYSADQVKQYAKSPSIQILENTTTVQAVKDIKLGLTAANFWKDTLSSVVLDQKIYLTCDKKAAVMVLENGAGINVSLADPTMLNEGLIHIQINRAVSGLVTSDPEITVKQLKPVLQFSVNTKGLKGRSVSAVFKQ